MSQQALGMVETRGLTAAIEAADAMIKSEEVTLVGTETVSYTHLDVYKRQHRHGIRSGRRGARRLCIRSGDPSLYSL